jgi:hypothetical protein
MNPISPKVIVSTIAALLVPILLTGILAGLDFLVSPEGAGMLATLPPIAQVMILAAAASAGAAVAGYLKADPLRQSAIDPGSEN